MPTVLELAGAEPDGTETEGLTLLAPDPGRPLFFEYFRPRTFLKGFRARFPECDFSELDRRLEGVQLGRSKLVRDPEGESRFSDLEADPAELRDATGTRPEVEDRLAALLDARAASGRAAAPGGGEELDALTLELLEAMGYRVDVQDATVE